MRMGIRTGVDWELAGAELARESDEEQTKFLKAFLKECRTWGTAYQVETQFSYINNKLTKEEKEALAMLSYQEGE